MILVEPHTFFENDKMISIIILLFSKNAFAPANIIYNVRSYFELLCLNQGYCLNIKQGYCLIMVSQFIFPK